MPDLKPTHKQLLRQGVLAYLAPRQPLAFTPASIARMIRRRQLVDIDFTEGDVAQALAFLRGLAFVGVEQDGFGPDEYWSATSKGVLEAERKGL